MSEPFEAAVRAGCDADVWAIDGHTRQPIRCRYPGCGKYCPSAKTAEAAIRAALPPNPAPETKERALWQACCGTDHCNAANHAPDHDISADGYAERYGCESKEMSDEFDRYYAAIRASLLPGEEPS